MERIGYRYVTMDFDDSHNPTIVDDWNSFDVSSLRSTYDLTCAFQVLEHFPWEDLGRHMTRLAQLSRKYVFVSLPYSCTGHTVTRTVHRSQCDTTVETREEYVPTNLPQRRYRDEFIREFPWAVHYWEIGRLGTSLADVLAVVSDCGLSVLRQFHSPNPYHYFILAAKR